MSMSNEPSEIDIAAFQYMEAKGVEAAATNARLAAEEHLISLIGLKEEGTTSKKTAYYKVSTTAKLNRTLIADRVPDAATALGDLIDMVVQWRPSLSLSGLRAGEVQPDCLCAYVQGHRHQAGQACGES